MFNGLVIEPTEIKFAAPYTRTVPVQLRLENSTADQVIAFKVKTVDPRRYTVKPSNGVIAPQGSANLTVELQPLADDAAIDQFVKTKQKFMIQSVSSSVESASQSVATMFASAGRIVETKLLCVFEGQTQANIEKSNSYMPAKSNAPEDDLNESLVSTLSSTGGTAESTASAVQGTPQVSSFAKPAPVSVSVSKDQSDLIIALLVIIIVMIALILAFK